MPRQAALLQGINVGSRRRVAMVELRALLEGLGYDDVRTYLQSGNVLLSSPTPSEQLARELRQGISERLGFDVAVVVRSLDELAAIVAGDPLAGVAVDPKLYQVSFLSAEPAADVVRAISARDLAPEQVVFSGREIYAWHPDGIHSSPLARLLSERRLGVSATARNWRTVKALLDL
ncbi:MAG: DUF1697 domain-containing protein [Solirubrobacteraceae bacterium]